ncbi:hypothetical protein [Flavobacterium lindanitolerans]|uniref:hypothetical protein n=1 Tax=Flavobacterium lindanitolerans TaxID=428988 RepID=UPI0031E0FFFD
MIPQQQTSLSEQELLRIMQKMNELLPNLSCPMCKNSDFVIAEGYFNNPLQFKLPDLSIGGRSIPTIGIICQNCGFVSQHALKTINLLPQNLK